MKFSGVCLITDNVQMLTEFYQDVLRCRPDVETNHADFNIDGYHISIFSKKGMERMAPGSMELSGTGCFTLGFEVKNVDEEYERIKDLNVNFVMLPTTHPWGSRSFWFKDPDGNIVDFFSVPDNQ